MASLHKYGFMDFWKCVEKQLINVLIRYSSWDRGEPMTYVMGEGTVIKGAEIGAIGMCVGEDLV